MVARGGGGGEMASGDTASKADIAVSGVELQGAFSHTASPPPPASFSHLTHLKISSLVFIPKIWGRFGKGRKAYR